MLDPRGQPVPHQTPPSLFIPSFFPKFPVFLLAKTKTKLATGTLPLHSCLLGMPSPAQSVPGRSCLTLDALLCNPAGWWIGCGDGSALHRARRPMEKRRGKGWPGPHLGVAVGRWYLFLCALLLFSRALSLPFPCPLSCVRPLMYAPMHHTSAYPPNYSCIRSSNHLPSHSSSLPLLPSFYLLVFPPAHLSISSVHVIQTIHPSIGSPSFGQ